MTERTDRELLELAAKAAGIKPQDGGPVVVYESGVWLCDNDEGTQYWNPLTDDGDALRLAVKLAPDDAMLVAIYGDRTLVGCQKRELGVSMHDGNPYAATRRAIVLAAVALGAKE